MGHGKVMRQRAARMKQDPSTLEILTAEFLDTLGIQYKPQHILGRDYILDFVGLD